MFNDNNELGNYEHYEVEIIRDNDYAAGIAERNNVIRQYYQ